MGVVPCGRAYVGGVSGGEAVGRTDFDKGEVAVVFRRERRPDWTAAPRFLGVRLGQGPRGVTHGTERRARQPVPPAATRLRGTAARPARKRDDAVFRYSARFSLPWPRGPVWPWRDISASPLAPRAALSTWSNARQGRAQRAGRGHGHRWRAFRAPRRDTRAPRGDGVTRRAGAAAKLVKITNPTLFYHPGRAAPVARRRFISCHAVRRGTRRGGRPARYAPWGKRVLACIGTVARLGVRPR